MRTAEPPNDPRRPGADRAPLVAVEGTAYECGEQYGRIVLRDYPGYRTYLDMAFEWKHLPAPVRRLVERRAAYLIDLYRGLTDAAGPGAGRSRAPGEPGCTSFGVSGAITTDGQPLAGQNKDTPVENMRRYIVLRMRIQDAPTILVLAYPGEVLGYGLWSTGMSLFRNSLYSSADSPRGLTVVQWGLLALAGRSVQDAVELARSHGIAGAGNCLISDPGGESLSVEFNAGGVSVVPARDGIATHANHPEGPETAPFEHYPDAVEKKLSRHRAGRLRELLERQRGGLTVGGAFAALSDHEQHPRGICRHEIGDMPGGATTAAVVASPARGRLHVVRGQPCCNPPATYTT